MKKVGKYLEGMPNFGRHCNDLNRGRGSRRNKNISGCMFCPDRHQKIFVNYLEASLAGFIARLSLSGWGGFS